MLPRGTPGWPRRWVGSNQRNIKPTQYKRYRNKKTGPGDTHRPGPFQLGEMAGNTRLPHSENFLEFGYGKLFLLEKEEQAQARGIGNQTEEINR